MDFLHTEMFDRVNQSRQDKLIIDAEFYEQIINDNKIDWVWLAPMFVGGFILGVAATILAYIMIF